MKVLAPENFVIPFGRLMGLQLGDALDRRMLPIVMMECFAEEQDLYLNHRYFYRAMSSLMPDECATVQLRRAS